MHGETVKITIIIIIIIITAFSLNMVKNCSLYVNVAVFIYIQTSNLSLIPNGSCPYMCSVFCVQGTDVPLYVCMQELLLLVI